MVHHDARYFDALVLVQESVERPSQGLHRLAVPLRQQRPPGVLHDHADPGNPGEDEHEVRHQAHRHDGPHVGTAQPLPQQEGILRADRHDQRQAGQQAVKRSVKHGPDTRLESP